MTKSNSEYRLNRRKPLLCVSDAMSINYPVPDVVITSDSGVEVTQKNDLIRTWYRTESITENFVETIFGTFLRG